MKSKYLTPLFVVILFAITTAASADVIVIDEDFGDRLTYPDASSALTVGTIDSQYPWDYDSYAYPSSGTLFGDDWSVPEPGDLGNIVDIGGSHGQVLMSYASGKNEDWGKVKHSPYMGPAGGTMFRPFYDLPLVIELKMRPAYYDPQPTDTSGAGYISAAQDWTFQDENGQYLEMACKWRFGLDTMEGHGLTIKYRLYYDGTLAQASRYDSPSWRAWQKVDIGGKDYTGAGIEFWEPCKNPGTQTGEWLEYRLVHDQDNQEVRIYLTDESDPLNHPFISGNGTDLDADHIISSFTLEQDENGFTEPLDPGRIRAMEGFQGGADQTAYYSVGVGYYVGDDNKDGSIGEFDDYKVYYPGTPTWDKRIMGQMTIAYPYWCWYKLEGVRWQARPPAGGGAAEAPVHWGFEDYDLWDASQMQKDHADYGATYEPNIPIVRDYVVGMVASGTYDFAIRHSNHLVDMVANVVVASGDATGVDVTLRPGDASGDFLNYWKAGPGVGYWRPDNDCDDFDKTQVNSEYDYGVNTFGYTYGLTFFKRNPSTGRSEVYGQSGDFDYDGMVTTWDTAVVDENSPFCQHPTLEGNKWYFEPNLDIQGIAEIGYPGWTSSAVELDYQVRPPGLPPIYPGAQGTISDPGDISCINTVGYPGTVSFQLQAAYPGIPPGSADLAVKHCNHTASLATIAVPENGIVEVTGISCGVLWGGDADGDDSYFTVYPADPKGDNDVDLLDYYVLFYQYHGGLPLTTGKNADFDCDGGIDLWDYYSLFYGYQNAKDLDNWYPHSP